MADSSNQAGTADMGNNPYANLPDEFWADLRETLVDSLITVTLAKLGQVRDRYEEK